MRLVRSIFALAARAARAVAAWVLSLSRWVIAMVIFVVCLILASFLIYILMKAIGLDDYTEYVLLVVYFVVVFPLGKRLFRWALGRMAGPDYFGPGSEGHNMGLRTKVKEVLKQARRRKPYPHA